MSQIIFTAPVDPEFRVVSLQEIEELIVSKGESYWNSPDGNGSASLSFYLDGWASGVPERIRLDFTMKSDLGFYFYYINKRLDGATDRRYACSTKEFADKTTISWAGGSRTVFQCLFVDHRTALEIVKQFFIDGGLSSSVNWLSTKEIPRIDG